MDSGELFFKNLSSEWRISPDRWRWAAIIAGLFLADNCCVRIPVTGKLLSVDNFLTIGQGG